MISVIKAFVDFLKEGNVQILSIFVLGTIFIWLYRTIQKSRLKQLEKEEDWIKETLKSYGEALAKIAQEEYYDLYHLIPYLPEDSCNEYYALIELKDSAALQTLIKRHIKQVKSMQSDKITQGNGLLNEGVRIMKRNIIVQEILYPILYLGLILIGLMIIFANAERIIANPDWLKCLIIIIMLCNYAVGFHCIQNLFMIREKWKQLTMLPCFLICICLNIYFYIFNIYAFFALSLLVNVILIWVSLKNDN